MAAGGLRLWFLLLVQAFALTVFMLGFFLTRHEVPHVSSCQDRILWGQDFHLQHGGGGNTSMGAEEHCWVPRRYSKLVMIVIDALRFDFAQHLSEAEIEVLTSGDAKIRYHLNKLPVVQEHLERSPSRSLLYRFEADPPTTTMQRLKGLTTGSLPTFLDLRKNFQSPAIVEDNLIHQFRSKGLRVVAMGDDTWELLFPGSFDRSFPYPSFNTRDIDTVDNGVAEHLLPELRQGDFDVLIAHFLGVDHVGHTYGPSHPAMERKLEEMNAALQAVIDALTDDALLVVMGDHGMTDDGNHGGATLEETEAALFLYSPKSPLLSTGDDGGLWVWNDHDHHYGGSLTQTSPSSSSSSSTAARRIAQVDLVPTLSLLLGIPIPYANLGGLVPELFYTSTTSRVAGLSNLCTSLYINARQVHRYLHKYASMASLPSEELMGLDQEFQDAVAHRLAATTTTTSGTSAVGEEEQLLLRACQGFRAYLRHALSLGQRVWTQYDVDLMLWGVALLAASLACLLQAMLLGGDGGGDGVDAPSWPLLLRATALGAGFALIASIILPGHFLSGSRTLAIPSLVLLTIVTTHHLHSRGPRLRIAPPSSPPPSLLDRLRPLFTHPQVVGCATLIVLHGSALFSNSYIEAEERLYLFFSVTAIFITLGPFVHHHHHHHHHMVWLLPSLMQRLAFEVKGHGQDVASHFSIITTVLPLIGILLLYHQQQQQPPHRRVTTTATIGAVFLCVVFYWLLDIESHGEGQGSPQHTLRLWSARAVMASPAPAMLLLMNPPRWLRAEGTKDWESPRSSQAFPRDLAMVVAGPLMLVLGPVSPLSIFCMMAEFALLGDAIHHQITTSTTLVAKHHHLSHGQQQKQNAAANEHAIRTAAVMLSFVGRSFFYATGHHNQFNRLQYSAAFVGFDEFEFYTGGLLLSLNTFGTELLAMLWTAAIFTTTTTSSSSSGTNTEYAVAAVQDGESGGPKPPSPLRVVAEVMVGMSTLRTLLTTLCVVIQRRHLMVWAIFAPKLIFDAALHIVHTGVAAALLLLLTFSSGGKGGGRKHKPA